MARSKRGAASDMRPTCTVHAPPPPISSTKKLPRAPRWGASRVEAATAFEKSPSPSLNSPSPSLNSPSVCCARRSAPTLARALDPL
eukprot:5799071-Pyramimonas_sp.AAC.1